MHDIDTPLIATRALSAGYGTRPVVRDLDIEVRPGEVVALLGPNGAGKSTTLRALSGDLAPMGGEVSWLGTPGHAPCTGAPARASPTSVNGRSSPGSTPPTTCGSGG